MTAKAVGHVPPNGRSWAIDLRIGNAPVSRLAASLYILMAASIRP